MAEDGCEDKHGRPRRYTQRFQSDDKDVAGFSLLHQEYGRDEALGVRSYCPPHTLASRNIQFYERTKEI